MKASTVGRFHIDENMLRNGKQDVQDIMGQCVIYRAEHNYASKRFEYIADCSQFKYLPEGLEMPLYKWEKRAGQWWADIMESK